MELKHRKAGTVDIIELSGRFDAYEVPLVNRWFDEHTTAQHVIVNLGGVGFIDSSGLSTLVKGLKRCRNHNGDLYLCNLQQAVTIIFELTRLDKAFNIYDDEQSALDAIPG